MAYPAALHVVSRQASADSPTVVFVHGSLDRGESFRRVMRRLPDLTTLAYDRRGYQGSRAGGLADAAREGSDAPVVAVGHSLGGDVVVAAALAAPGAFGAIGAYEPPMPWLGFRRQQPGDDPETTRAWPPMSPDPGEEVEHFFSRMVGASAWARLTDEGRAQRRADGPALVADLRSLRGEGPPFDVMQLAVPVVFGMGGPTTRPHHRRTVEWLGGHVPGAVLYEIEGAQHGAHLSHPDHFATLTRLVVDYAPPRGG
jgi:pimeloyl-ACP methyl ester carboxylesterase